MTIDVDIKDKPKADREARLFNFTSPPGRPGSLEQADLADLAYADVELSTTVETSDFDVSTIAIVGGIIVFKLSMLGLLLASI